MMKIGISAPEAGPEVVWGAARKAAELPGLSLDQRRQRFLRCVRDALGPAQFQHVTAHCEHVSRTAVQLAHLMGLGPGEVETIRAAGLLHDLGKALVPDAMLAKPGPLSASEREVLDRHAADGAAICQLLGADPDVVEAVRLHHTRHDRNEAPLAARIVSVADALVTMTSDRPYSAARSFSEALSELRLGRGTQFDPSAVVAAHILGASAMAKAA